MPIMPYRKLINHLRSWAEARDAVAAVEFAFVFPILFVLMLGIWDLGNAIIINQKTIAASQMVNDLICRQEIVSDEALEQAFMAGTLALSPYDTTPLKIDIVSVEYDEDDDPVLLWEETSDGSAGDDTLVASTAGLGTEGDGAVVVQVTYEFEPSFAGVIGQIHMNEKMFGRGRKSAHVQRE